MTKREICERLWKITTRIAKERRNISGIFDVRHVKDYSLNALECAYNDLRDLLLDLAAPETEEKPVQEPKSKFPIGHPLHMSTEEMKAADTALFIQTGGRMGKDWRNAEERKEPPVLIYEENGEKVPCPVCGAPAAPIKNKPGLFRCKRCGGLVCAKEGEGK